MIKEKTTLIEEGAIIGVKFVSGEDVMAKIGKILGDQVELILPHSLVTSHEGAAFMAWPSMVSDDSFFVHKNKIMIAYPLREDFLNQYSPLHGEVEEEKAGIFMPPEKKIIS